VLSHLLEYLYEGIASLIIRWKWRVDIHIEPTDQRIEASEEA
jgi:hypothetical protein